jgi:hypothetical protein
LFLQLALDTGMISNYLSGIRWIFYYWPG